jgi:hypothetical protein
MEITGIKKTGITTTLSEYILISLDSPDGSDRFEKIYHHFHSITRKRENVKTYIEIS